MALGCPSANFTANKDPGLFADTACREFSVLYEKHGYGCSRVLYASVSAWYQFGGGLIFRQDGFSITVIHLERMGFHSMLNPIYIDKSIWA